MGTLKFGTFKIKCPLAFGDNRRGLCSWCGKELTGKQRRWCSTKCSRAPGLYHCWQDARRQALKRAKKICSRCGTGEDLDWLWKTGKTSIEVNHISPILGKHNQWGCWNHPENLEVLCHGCHVLVTNEQRKAGMFEGP